MSRALTFERTFFPKQTHSIEDLRRGDWNDDTGRPTRLIDFVELFDSYLATAMTICWDEDTAVSDVVSGFAERWRLELWRGAKYADDCAQGAATAPRGTWVSLWPQGAALAAFVGAGVPLGYAWSLHEERIPVADIIAFHVAGVPHEYVLTTCS